MLSVPWVLLDSPGRSRALPTRSAPVCVLLPRSIRFVAPSSQARSSRRPSRFGPAWIALRPRVLHESGSCAGKLPRLLIPYNLTLPPVECWFGSNPNQAANSALAEGCAVTDGGHDRGCNQRSDAKEICRNLRHASSLRSDPLHFVVHLDDLAPGPSTRSTAWRPGSASSG